MAALNKILLSDNVTELGNVKSVVFSETVNSDVNLRPGCVASASIEVEVFNTQANAVAAGDVVYYYQNDKNNTTTLIGQFNCEPSIKTKNSYRFVAYDNAQKLNADFSQWLRANQSNFPKTVKQLVQQACTIAGVTLGSTSWPLSTQNVQAFYADGLTCRDIISYAAEIACKFVRCHTDGKLYFDWYTTNSNSIAPSAGTNQYAYKQDGLTYANFTTTALARVAVHPSGEDDVAYIYPVNVTSGNTLDIKDNLLLTGADASFYNSVAQTVYTAMSALGTYRPMTASLFPRENPFRAGDIVSVTDSQSVTFTAPITGQTVSNSAATLESVGNETYTDYSGSAKGLTQLASDIVRINKLKVGWAEIDNAIVNYLTANDITAQNLTIVDENGTVLATYNASGIVLGQTSKGHAEIDYHAFELYDKDGNVYLSIGDLRGVNGTKTMIYSSNYNVPTASITLMGTVTSVTSVKVAGSELSSDKYSVSGSTITFNPSVSGWVRIEYRTPSPVYHYNMGTVASGTEQGFFSSTIGQNQEASADFSSVSGGSNNSVTGRYSSVGGGYNNSVSGAYSSVGGGSNNVSSNRGSSICGGYDNTTNGSYNFIGGGENNSTDNPYSIVCGGSRNSSPSQGCAVVGGYRNTSQGYAGFVGGGSDNTVSGVGAVVPGGDHNTASGTNSTANGKYSVADHKSQFVFGEYNETDGSSASGANRGNYVEIVGNGTADNNRSNARTLDWSGNETLAGGLTTGGNVSVTGDISATGDVSANDISATGAMSADSLTLTTPLPISSGGFGGTDAATALANLGLGGLNFATDSVSNSSVTFSIGNNHRGIVITSGGGTSLQSLTIFNANSSGTLTKTDVQAATNVSISWSDGLVVTNSSSATAYVMVFYI